MHWTMAAEEINEKGRFLDVIGKNGDSEMHLASRA